MVDWTGWRTRIKEKRRWKRLKKGGGREKSRETAEMVEGKNIHSRLVPSSLEFTHFGSNVRWNRLPRLPFMFFFLSFSLLAIIPTFSHLSLTAPRAATPAPAPPRPFDFLLFHPYFFTLFFSLSADISLSCKLGCLSSLISKQAPIPQRSLYLPIQPTLGLIPGLLAVCQE